MFYMIKFSNKMDVNDALPTVPFAFSEKAKKESDSFFVNCLFKKKISLISHTNVRKEILITHMANQSNTKRKNYTY